MKKISRIKRGGRLPRLAPNEVLLKTTANIQRAFSPKDFRVILDAHHVKASIARRNGKKSYRSDTETTFGTVVCITYFDPPLITFIGFEEEIPKT